MQGGGAGGMIGLLAAAALAVAPAPQPQPLTIGETVTLEALGAERSVNIVLPPDYAAEPERRWPVVYLLDGAMKQDLMMGAGLMRWGALWGRSKDAIIVGIETKDRTRELLPATGDAAEREKYPTAGESTAFRAWIAEAVKPMVEARYRHDGTAFLVGESAAGHFVVETWATSPALFTGYAAISPSMQWDFEALSRRALGDAEAPAALSQPRGRGRGDRDGDGAAAGCAAQRSALLLLRPPHPIAPCHQLARLAARSAAIPAADRGGLVGGIRHGAAL